MRWRLRSRRAIDPASLSPFEYAVLRFNAGDAGRTVRGLVRTLGVPSVSVGASAGAADEVRVTVAWELSWYQWSVEVGETPGAVALLGQGSEVEQLDPAARQWNASVARGGRIVLAAPSRRRAAAATPVRR